MPSPRVLKLADQIKEIVAAMLERRVKDPRLGFVTVTDVRTVSVQSKPKRRGVSKGRRPGWKKAIVELRPGDKIELFEGA